MFAKLVAASNPDPTSPRSIARDALRAMVDHHHCNTAARLQADLCALSIKRYLKIMHSRLREQPISPKQFLDL
jgi:hypothetical protein